MAKATVVEAWDATWRQQRKLTFTEHLPWVRHFLFILVLTRTAAFAAGGGDHRSHLSGNWSTAGELTWPRVPLPVNRQLGCLSRFVFSFASECLSAKPLSVFWAPRSSSVHGPKGEWGLWGSSTQRWTQGKQDNKAWRRDRVVPSDQAGNREQAGSVHLLSNSPA